MIINDIPLGVANCGFRQFALTEKTQVACGKKSLSGK
jgi:hypothetical protein